MFGGGVVGDVEAGVHLFDLGVGELVAVGPAAPSLRVTLVRCDEDSFGDEGMLALPFWEDRVILLSLDEPIERQGSVAFVFWSKKLMVRFLS